MDYSGIVVAKGTDGGENSYTYQKNTYTPASLSLGSDAKNSEPIA